jgi:glycosyltransferase involved in cell wall biosynthesis
MAPKNKMLMVGQIPPPFLGQAIMTKMLLDTLEGEKIPHKFINQTLSRETSSFHKVNGRKVILVLQTIIKIYYYRIFQGYNILYYNPSGHRKIAILRDIVILSTTRWLFKKTVFHFHAYGLNIVRKKFNLIFKLLFRISFHKPDLMIKLTIDQNLDELILEPKKIEILPNACYKPLIEIRKNKRIEKKVKIVYVGAIYEERGIDDIIDLVSYSQKQDSLEIEVNFIGEFMNHEYEKTVINSIINQGVNKHIHFSGTKIGKVKSELIEQSHFLIFPSRVPSETFGLVLIEAMALKTPPISTNLNGPKYVIQEGKNGIKYMPRDIKKLYEKILWFSRNSKEYENLRESCAESYKTNYTEEIYKKNVSKIFRNLVS